MIVSVILSEYGAAPPPPEAAQPASRQSIYTATLQHDKESLDRGVLTYSPINRLKTATSKTFKVVVTDVGRGPQQITLHTASGMIVYQQDVPTGASVGVEIVNCGDLICKAESSDRQLILQPGEAADWFWLITAGQPGPAEITLRVDTYDQGSQQILTERVINISGSVLTTAAFQRQQSNRVIATVAHNGISVTETIGTLAGSLTAIAGALGGIIVWRRRRKRTTGQPPDEHGQPNNQAELPAASDSSPSVKGQESQGV